MQQRMSQVLSAYPEVQMAALTITSSTGQVTGATGSTRRPNRGTTGIKTARLLGIQV